MTSHAPAVEGLGAAVSSAAPVVAWQEPRISAAVRALVAASMAARGGQEGIGGEGKFAL